MLVNTNSKTLQPRSFDARLFLTFLLFRCCSCVLIGVIGLKLSIDDLFLLGLQLVPHFIKLNQNLFAALHLRLNLSHYAFHCVKASFLLNDQISNDLNSISILQVEELKRVNDVLVQESDYR